MMSLRQHIPAFYLISTPLPTSCCEKPTCVHFLFPLTIGVAAMQANSLSESMSSGRRVRNWATWMKSIWSSRSSYRRRIPRPVLNRISSPSRQNTSHTRHATSSGNDLLYNVKILWRHKHMHTHTCGAHV